MKKMFVIAFALIAALSLVSCGLIPLPATEEQQALVDAYTLAYMDMLDMHPELFRVDELEGKTVHTLKIGYEDESKGIVIETLEHTLTTDESSLTVVITGTLGTLGRHELVIGKTYENGKLASYLVMIDAQLYTFPLKEPV